MTQSDNYWDSHYGSNDRSIEAILRCAAVHKHATFKDYLQPPSLEIGPGTGEFARVSGVTDVLDVSQACLDRIRADRPAIRTHHYTTLPLPFADRSFQTIVCIDALHHIQESISLADFFEEIDRILVPAGHFLVSDRRATWFNRIELAVNALGRTIFLTLSPRRRLLGGTVELPMRAEDYSRLRARFDVVAYRRARPLLATGGLAISFFLSLLVPPAVIYPWAIRWIGFCERHLRVFLQDASWVLKKRD